MYVLAGIALLLVLLAFVVWDRRRLQSGKVIPLPREALAGGWKATPALVWPFHVGVSLCAALVTAMELYSPSEPPFLGRMSSIYAAAHGMLGIYGVAYFWLAVTLVLLLLALVSWLAGTPRAGNVP